MSVIEYPHGYVISNHKKSILNSSSFSVENENLLKIKDDNIPFNISNRILSHFLYHSRCGLFLVIECMYVHDFPSFIFKLKYLWSKLLNELKANLFTVG